MEPCAFSGGVVACRVVAGPFFRESCLGVTASRGMAAALPTAAAAAPAPENQTNRAAGASTRAAGWGMMTLWAAASAAALVLLWLR